MTTPREQLAELSGLGDLLDPTSEAELLSAVGETGRPELFVGSLVSLQRWQRQMRRQAIPAVDLDDRTIQGLDDWIGFLYLRDRIQTGVGRLSLPLQAAVTQWLTAIDDELAAFTRVEPELGVYVDQFRSRPPRSNGSWWLRIPNEGLISDEFVARVQGSVVPKNVEK